MTTQWAYLGPIGALREIPNPGPGVQVTTNRVTSEMPLLGGGVEYQLAPRGPREWAIEHTWLDAAQAGFLKACAQGAVPGPLHLLTADAAVTNMLAPHLAAPGMGGDDTLGPRSSRRVLVDGVPMVGVELAAGFDITAWSDPFAIRPGVPLALSMRATSATSIATYKAWAVLELFDAAGVSVDHIDVGNPAAGLQVSGYKLETPPSTAVSARLGLAADVAGVTIGALRLTEGAHSGPWQPGAGGARVIVREDSQTLQAVWDSRPRSDYAFTLREEA